MRLSYGFIFFFKQKTAYEMRISDWSSDVCSSDLRSIADRSQCAIKQQQDQDEAGRNDQLQPLARRLQVFELAATFEIGAGRQPNLAGDRCLRDRKSVV